MTVQSWLRDREGVFTNHSKINRNSSRVHTSESCGNQCSTHLLSKNTSIHCSPMRQCDEWMCRWTGLVHSGSFPMIQCVTSRIFAIQSKSRNIDCAMGMSGVWIVDGGWRATEGVYWKEEIRNRWIGGRCWALKRRHDRHAA